MSELVGLLVTSNKHLQDGIALSPDFSMLYFCPVSSSSLFSVPALQLFDFSLQSEQLKVEFVGYKGFSDGMAFSKVRFVGDPVCVFMLLKSGVLFFGSNEEVAMKAWTPGSTSVSAASVVFSSETDEQWADTLAFDDDALALVWTTNRLTRFFAGTLDPHGANFRVLSSVVGSVSYVNSGNPQPHSAPCIPQQVQ